MRNPQGDSPSNARSNPTSHNEHLGLVTGLVSRSGWPATPASSPGSPHITPATESGDTPPEVVVGEYELVPVRLHPFGLFFGQQRVRHESVTVEDGVVAHAPSVRGASR